MKSNKSLLIASIVLFAFSVVAFFSFSIIALLIFSFDIVSADFYYLVPSLYYISGILIIASVVFLISFIISLKSEVIKNYSKTIIRVLAVFSVLCCVAVLVFSGVSQKSFIKSYTTIPDENKDVFPFSEIVDVKNTKAEPYFGVEEYKALNDNYCLTYYQDESTGIDAEFYRFSSKSKLRRTAFILSDTSDTSDEPKVIKYNGNEYYLKYNKNRIGVNEQEEGYYICTTEIKDSKYVFKVCDSKYVLDENAVIKAMSKCIEARDSFI